MLGQLLEDVASAGDVVRPGSCLRPVGTVDGTDFILSTTIRLSGTPEDCGDVDGRTSDNADDVLAPGGVEELCENLRCFAVPTGVLSENERGRLRPLTGLSCASGSPASIVPRRLGAV